jgi:hypothetical protein
MSSPSAHRLTRAVAGRFARLALGHVAREYPNKLDHVLAGPHDARRPRELHPIFYGSYDWHSCVHGYWLLARLLRRAPEIPEAAQIRALFEAAFTPDKVAGELAYLHRPHAAAFERPYGWAWLLALQAELLAHTDRLWAERVRPLADAIAGRFHEYLPKATYPVRAGAHGNTAFALALAADYARTSEETSLLALLQATARRWYLHDQDAQAWEPSGDEFLSPTLMEAECLRRLLPSAEFLTWFAAFLPRAADGEPRTLFEPAAVSDRTDGKIVHLDGLNLSRAWCWREIATALPPGEPLALRATETADRHLAASLPHIVGDYVGEHWLASFALLALGAKPHLPDQ